MIAKGPGTRPPGGLNGRGPRPWMPREYCPDIYYKKSNAVASIQGTRPAVEAARMPGRGPGAAGVGKYWGQHPGRKQRPRGLMGASCWPCCLARYINPTSCWPWIDESSCSPVASCWPPRWILEPRRCWLVLPDRRAARAAAVSIQGTRPAGGVARWILEPRRCWLLSPDRRAARAEAVSIQEPAQLVAWMEESSSPPGASREPAQRSPLVV